MTFTLYHGDCLEEMARIDAGSVDLIVTDPPYFKVKREWWDNQWYTADGFLSWLDDVLAEFYRVLAPNGSLYLFASPRMAARVEVLTSERFNVLNRIRWVKVAGWHNKARKEDLRAYLSPWEEIVFAEHYGADNMAKGEAGYGAKCDELRGFIFEPIRRYLVKERDRAGLTTGDVDREWQRFRNSKGCMAGHWFGVSQWALPTEENYNWLRQTMASLNHGGDYLRREYEELRREYEELRREYEELRREYEELRRPFNVSTDVRYTDVWDFPTVQHYPGKHPAEKPPTLLEHIIKASSREGDTVLDAFMGSGATGEAAIKHGREFIGIDIMERWHKRAEHRITEAANAARQLELL